MKLIITEEERSRILGMHKNVMLNEVANPKDDASLKYIFDQIAIIFNNEIKANPKLGQTQLTVLVKPHGENDNLYRWMFGSVEVPGWGEYTVTTNGLISYGAKYVGDLITKTFNFNFNKKLPKTLQSLDQTKFKTTLNDWISQYQPQKPGGTQVQPVKKP